MGGCQAPETPPRLYPWGAVGHHASVLAGFCLPFVLKQRCLPDWVIHSCCMYAGTMQKQFCGCGAMISGSAAAKQEHEKNGRHRQEVRYYGTYTRRREEGISATEAFNKNSKKIKKKSRKYQNTKRKTISQAGTEVQRYSKGREGPPEINFPKGSNNNAKKQSNRQGHTVFGTYGSITMQCKGGVRMPNLGERLKFCIQQSFLQHPPLPKWVYKGWVWVVRILGGSQAPDPRLLRPKACCAGGWRSLAGPWPRRRLFTWCRLPCPLGEGCARALRLGLAALMAAPMQCPPPWPLRRCALGQLVPAGPNGCCLVAGGYLPPAAACW